MRLKHLCLLFLISFLFFSKISFAQQSTSIEKLKIVTEGIDYIGDIDFHNENIYCLGYKNFDDTRQSRLNKYDGQLNLIWSLKLDDKLNRFDRMTIHNNKIYLTGIIGKIGMYRFDSKRYFLEISMDGKILNKIDLGGSVQPCTNMEYHDGSIWFAHVPVKFGSAPKSNDKLCEVVSYSIEKGEINRFKSNLKNSFPKNLMLTPSGIFVVGTRVNHVDLLLECPFILKLKNGRLEEKLLCSNQKEFLINSFYRPATKEIVFYSKYTMEKEHKKLIIRAYDFDLQKTRSLEIAYKDLKIKSMDYHAYWSMNEVWIIGEKGAELYYQNFDENGKLLNSIHLPSHWQAPKPFLISPERQVQLVYRIDVLGSPYLILSGKDK